MSHHYYPYDDYGHDLCGLCGNIQSDVPTYSSKFVPKFPIFSLNKHVTDNRHIGSSNSVYEKSKSVI